MQLIEGIATRHFFYFKGKQKMKGLETRIGKIKKILEKMKETNMLHKI